jgi:hypothetical protein
MSAKAVLLAWLLVARSVLADDPALPDPALAPGEWNSDVTVRQLQQIGYSRRARHVSEELRREVFARYGIEWTKRNDYEVDHLCPIAIGGSNPILILWPEPVRLNINGKDLGAVTKDALEGRLHWLLVSGQLELRQAQKEISTNWEAAYLKYCGPFPAALSLSDH